MKELVSVIIPAYNHEKYVRDSIESVLNQSYKNLEIIIEDDCSTDHTKKIIESIKDKRIKKIFSKRNKGPVDTMNDLISRCNGKYIAIIASDDIWYPTKIEEQLRIFKDNPKLGAVFTETDFIDENGNIYEKSDRIKENVFSAGNMSSSKRLRVFFEKGNNLCHPSSMIPKKIFDELGLYDKSYRQLHDYEFWIRLLQKYDIYVIEKHLMGYRKGINEDLSISSNIDKNNIRLYNELSFINFKMLMNMNNKIFIEGFSDLFKDKNAKTDIQLLCERYFILLNKPFGCFNKVYALSSIYDYYNKDELFSTLEKKYGYTMKDFYEDSSKYKIYNLFNEEERIIEKERKIAELELEINNILNSKSWKITKPLRALRRKK